MKKISSHANLAILFSLAILPLGCTDDSVNEDSECPSGIYLNGVCCDTSNGYSIINNECVQFTGGPGGNGQTPPDMSGNGQFPGSDSQNPNGQGGMTQEVDESVEVEAEESVEDVPEIDASSCAVIDLSASSIASTNTSEATVEIDAEDSSLVEIEAQKEGACIQLKGSWDGTVKFKKANNYNVNVILDNVSITSDKAEGGLKIKNDSELDPNVYTIKLVGKNKLVGAYTSGSKKVLNSEASLSIAGDGELEVEAHYKCGIGVDDVFKIYSGSVKVKLDRTESTVYSEVNEETGETVTDPEKGFAIKVGNGFEMVGGALNIIAHDSKTQDIGYEARGLKVDGIDNAYGDGKGYINIKAGNIVIQSDTKALFAGWDASEDAYYNEGTPEPNVDISGGTINIKTLMSAYESMGGMGGPGGNTDTTTSSASRSPEGIEGKNNITISGGEITITASDDAINAGKLLTISGGKIVAYSTGNDAIDSNGKLVVSGGLTVGIGMSEPEGGIDADNSSNFSFSGGTVIGIGGMNNSPANVSKGSFVTAALATSSSTGGMDGGNMGGGASQYAGKIIALTASGSKDVIAAIKLPGDFAGGSNLLIVDEDIKKESTYDVYSDASLSLGNGASWFSSSLEAVLDGSASVSGTASSTVTAGQDSGSNMGGNMGGGK